MEHIIPLRGIKCKSDTADVVSYYNISNVNVIVYNIFYIDNKVVNEIISNAINNENENDFQKCIRGNIKV